MWEVADSMSEPVWFPLAGAPSVNVTVELLILALAAGLATWVCAHACSRAVVRVNWRAHWGGSGRLSTGLEERSRRDEPAANLQVNVNESEVKPPRSWTGRREWTVMDRNGAGWTVMDRYERTCGSVADLAVGALERVVAGGERGQEVGVELARGLAQDHRDRPRVGQGRLVEALAAQGVVDVGEGRQAGGRRDRGAGQLVRVTGAVVTFVVAADDVAGHPQKVHRSAVLLSQRLQDAVADQRMGPHLGALGLRQRGRLQEDVVGQADLADVVQDHAALQLAEEAAVYQAGPGAVAGGGPGQGDDVALQPAQVAGRLAVAGLGHPGQGEEYRVVGLA